MSNELELGDFKSYKEVLDFVPRSVWDVNSRTEEIKKLFIDDLDKHTCKRSENGYPQSIKQRYSVFNPLLGINILKIWSNVDDRVIDPFAGRDRAIISNYMHRHYKGYEISPSTYNMVVDKISNWEHLNSNYDCLMTRGDGTNIKEDTLYDFCYSCPPYWFKEKYESVDGQISDIDDEEEWRESIYNTAISLKKCMKIGRYAVFVIGDIRHKTKLIPLHSHWIDEFLKAGWSLKDIVINKTNPMNVCGINGYLRNRITMKSHEYVLVFKNI